VGTDRAAVALQTDKLLMQIANTLEIDTTPGFKSAVVAPHEIPASSSAQTPITGQRTTNIQENEQS